MKILAAILLIFYLPAPNLNNPIYFIAIFMPIFISCLLPLKSSIYKTDEVNLFSFAVFKMTQSVP